MNTHPTASIPYTTITSIPATTHTKDQPKPSGNLLIHGDNIAALEQLLFVHQL